MKQLEKHPKNFLYNYRCKLVRVVDGDTVIANIDLGFYTWREVVLRLADIDAPEIRTKDLEEKEKGYKSAHRLELELLDENPDKIFYIKSKGVDSFGRSIATIYTKQGENINSVLLNENLAEEW